MSSTPGDDFIWDRVDREVSEAVRRAMAARKMKSADLLRSIAAVGFTMSQSYLSALLSDDDEKRKRWNLQTLAAVAAALGMDPAELLAARSGDVDQAQEMALLVTLRSGGPRAAIAYLATIWPEKSAGR